MNSHAPPIVHRCEIRARYGESDQMGVVHHAVYVSYFEVARTEMMRLHGLSYAEMESRGTLLAVIDVGLKYHAPAHFDEPLAVETWVAEAGRVKVRFEYRVLREDAGGPRLLCSGHTVLACVNRELAPRRLEDADRELLQRLARGEA